MKKYFVIFVFWAACQSGLAQSGFRVDKRKAPDLHFEAFKKQPEKSRIETIITAYDTVLIAKKSRQQAQMHKKKIQPKQYRKNAADFSAPQKIRVSWQAQKPAKVTSRAVPDLLFKDNSKHNIKYLDKAHGLLSNAVTAIARDSLGVIWLGTADEGLCSYQGQSMKVYNEDSGLPSNSINDLLIDRQGRLWISTAAGIAYLYGNEIYIPSFAPLQQGTGANLYEDSNGNIWMTVRQGGTYCFDGEQLLHYSRQSGLPGNDVTTVYHDAAGTLWFGLHSDGLCSLRDGQYSYYSFHDNPNQNSAKSMYFYEGVLYLGFFNMPLISFEGGEFYSHGLYDEQKSTIYSMTSNHRGLWMAAYGAGVVNMQNQQLTYYNTDKGLTGKSAYDLLSDEAGNIWVTDLFAGISRIDQDVFWLNDKQKEIPVVLSVNIREDKHGNIWYLPNGGNLVKESSEHYVLYDNGDYYPDFELHHAFDGEFTEKGEIYLSTYSAGVLKITPKQFEYARFDSGNFVMQSTSGHPDQIWFATMMNGLKKLDHGVYYDFTSQHGLVSDQINCIELDRDGALWVGSSMHGINIINHDRIALLNMQTGLPSNKINCFFADDERFWVGTAQGLALFEADSVSYFDASCGLISNKIRSVTKDHHNHYWIATSEGLSRLILENGLATIKNYGREYGLHVTDFNTAVYVRDDGHITWGTNSNLLHGRPEADEGPKPKIRLNWETAIFNDSVQKDLMATTETIEVMPDKSVSISYFAIDWGNESMIKYWYSLLKEGARDTIWNDQGRNQNLRLKALPTGNYQVLLYATAGNKRSELRSLPLHFLPHWWETKVFRTLLMIVFIVLGPMIFLLYSVINSRKRQKLEALINEKTIQLVEENKIKDALVQEIHHRVKNNLQSITSLIEMQIYSSPNASGKKALVDTQLRISAMALVHEMLYTSNDFGKVSAKKYLEELIHSINGMVNADKLPLSFRLEVEDFTIGMSNCISFGLLTSEIISNAIKYAFTDIENPEILISFKLEGNNVEYAITDNGTGFDPEKIDKDKSLGIKLIDIFSRQLDASLRYEFLPGTRVSLSIPTNKLL